ncbi:MAG: hypothetical protein LBB46_04635 [Coriobacteriaceae bacterium]|jgi:hypothetical protein|nr:hypothetical protein [Coriobacteriaceae bacterium]
MAKKKKAKEQVEEPKGSIEKDFEEGGFAGVEDTEETGLDVDDFVITKEQVAETTDDFNAIFREGAAAAKDLKDAFDDIKSAFDFKSIFK